ncbi:MAG: branched-chain amino acid ABC transporter permease [Pedococcus sp.]
MSGTLLLSQLVNGVGTGMIYFLLAVGLTLIFGVRDFVNFAHGAFFVLGALLSWTITSSGISFWVALVVAPLTVGVLGLVLEPVLLRHFYSVPPAFQIVGTIGLTLVIQEVATMIWEPVNRTTQAPPGLRGLVDLGPITYPAYRLFIMAVAVVVGVALWYVIGRTRFGSNLRAGAENRDMAACLGINTSRLFAVTFALGVGLAALGGVLAGPTRGFSPASSNEVLGIAFVIIVVGGMGSFIGAFVGAILIGVAQSLTIIQFPAYGNVVIYLLMIAVLLVKSDGLFGKVTRVR